MKKDFIKTEGKVLFPCYVKTSIIDRKGAFASAKIPARRKIGELSGFIVPLNTIPEKFSVLASIAIVELDNRMVLDCRKLKNEMCYANHSCDPNCYMRIRGTRVELYTLKNIRKDEELTLDYGETHHEGKRKCTCGAANCRGWI